MKNAALSRRLLAFWRDERVLMISGQVLVGIAVVALLSFLYQNMVSNLQRQGMTLGYGFFRQVAGFDIAESLLPYSRSSSYIQAFSVGLLNTLLVSILGIFVSTILGVIVGVARLSRNFLTNRIAAVYIEILRNIPLLVLLVFWYKAVFLKLPRVRTALELPGPVFISNRGIAFPWGIPNETFQIYVVLLIFGLVIASTLAIILIRRGRQTGRMPLWMFWGLVTFVGIALAGWFLMPDAPLTKDDPYLAGLNLAGGKVLSPEFLALLSGLAIYTSAFIAEVVRAGIQSVSHGQVEAARALGLNGVQTLRLVIFPQALRVIIPPLTSQYLNLTKNSSLAVAIAYPDLFYVSSTIINQSGRAVEMLALVMLVYLTTSLITAAFMNWYNAKIKLVER
jgi:general L-amino acid transport system permease protein